MAVYDLEEQEQLAELKAWWNQYGNMVTWLIVAVSLGVIAWQAWNYHQRSQSAEASGLYFVLQKAAQERDTQKTKSAAGELVEKYGRTTYAALGALTAAKLLNEAGDTKSAIAQLSWAAEHARDEFRDMARLNLAALQLDEKLFDEAIKTLSSGHSEAFSARFSELKGDVLLAQGKKPEAAAAYKEAVTAFDAAAKKREQDQKANPEEEAQSPYREILQQKADSQGAALVAPPGAGK